MGRRTKNIKHTAPGPNQLPIWGQKRYSAPRVIKLAAHTTPDFVETRNQDWISFGKENNYPQYLIKLFNRSAKHNAIVNAKVNYTTGAGWEFKEKQLTNLKSESIIKSINPDGESLNEVSFKADMDLEIFGGFYLEIIWDKAGRKIGSIKHIDFSKIRSNSDNTVFYYTADWFEKDGRKKRNPEENEDWTEFLVFNPEKRRGRQLFYYKSYRPSMATYALPEYIGAVEYIETDTLISNHCYNDTKNGFVGNTIISLLNGQPETEAKEEEIEELILEKFTGSDGQRVLIEFADGEDKASKVTHLTPPDIFKRMTDLAKSIEQEILTGHRVTSGMLVGIKTEGQLGGRTEMIDAYELMKNTYIKPKQKVLEEVFNFILSYNAVDPVQLIESQPIGVQFGESTLTQIATKDELREIQGLPKLDAPVKTQSQITLDALNGLSPLLATKVLDTMTPNQLLGLVGLPPVPGGDLPPPRDVAAAAFSEMGDCIKKYMEHGKSYDQALAICMSEKEKGLLEKTTAAFKKYGTPKSGMEVLRKRFVTFEKVEQMAASELNLHKQNFVQYTSLERSILDLLKKDPKMDAEGLAKALKVSKSDVDSAIAGLVKSKDLKTGGTKDIPELTVTVVGETAIEEKPAKTADIFVMYSYEVIPGMGKPVIDTTRDFCRELIALDKLYTREDIEMISAEVGYNVFEMRGGWMTKPGTTVHIPHCRHIWQQNIVTKK